jgi:hypothetical protein
MDCCLRQSVDVGMVYVLVVVVLIWIVASIDAASVDLQMWVGLCKEPNSPSAQVMIIIAFLMWTKFMM